MLSTGTAVVASKWASLTNSYFYLRESPLSISVFISEEAFVKYTYSAS